MPGIVGILGVVGFIAWLCSGIVTYFVLGAKAYEFKENDLTQTVFFVAACALGPIGVLISLALPDAEPCSSGSKHDWERTGKHSNECGLCGLSRESEFLGDGWLRNWLGEYGLRLLFVIGLITLGLTIGFLTLDEQGSIASDAEVGKCYEILNDRGVVTSLDEVECSATNARELEIKDEITEEDLSRAGVGAQYVKECRSIGGGARSCSDKLKYPGTGAVSKVADLRCHEAPLILLPSASSWDNGGHLLCFGGESCTSLLCFREQYY